MTGSELVKYFESLKLLRLPLEQHIRDCYKYSHPIRGIHFNSSLDSTPETIQQEAATAQADMTDSTATDSAHILASTLVSGLTPANSRWAGIEAVGEENSEIKTYLDKKAEDIHNGIHSSNFDPSAYESMLDVVDAGYCALFIEEGDETDFNFEAWPLPFCFVASTRKDGVVDTICRYFTLTAQQAVREYEKQSDQLPEKIHKAIEADPYKRFPFIHFIMPKRFDKGKRKRKKDALLPFASYHVAIDNKKIVRDGGFAEFPVAVPRWLRIPNSAYAQGPMSTVLPDAKTLNLMETKSLDNFDMQTYGMWGAVDDGVLNAKTVKIGPKKMVMMREKNSFFPINPPGKPDWGSIKAEEKRRQIRRIMMADQLEPLQSQGPVRTATEWHYRVSLIRQLLGPMYGRLQSEYLQRIVFRCLGILMRKDIREGKQLPEALRNKSLRLRYISPLARAQQLEDVAAMDRFEEGLIAKAGTSEEMAGLLDLYQWDEAERKRAKFLGVPETLILTDDKVKELRKVREDRAAKAAASQNKPIAQPAAGGMEMVANG